MSYVDEAVTSQSTTIADILPRAVELFGDRVAQKHKVDGEWRDVAFTEVSEIVSEIGRGLIDLGLEPGERVSVLCTTRVEWTWCSLRDQRGRRGRRADLSDQLAGGVRVGRRGTRNRS